LLDSILLLAGLLLLVKGADLLVSGAASIATRLRISPLVIGLTIVSFGTSLPETLVTMISGLRGNADLAIANLIGSNIANVLLVLGVAAIIRPLPVRDSTVVSEIPFSLTAAILVGFLANAALFTTHHELSISRLDGVILLFFFLLFMLYVYKVARETIPAETSPASLSRLRAVAYILVGTAGLYLGGRWTVEGAIALARLAGVDDALIGLTVIAIGTSLPELIASAVAAYRNQADMAVGNVVGSNIFNLLWILGLTACFVDMPFKVVSNSDLVMVIVSSSMIILALVSSRQNTILRSHGIAFVTFYAAYLAYVVLR
jgi:cation:H+ antiporter